MADSKNIFSETIKIYLIIISLSIVLGIYLIELYFSNLTYTFHNSKQIENYDLRTKIEVLEDLKKEDVVPSISPKYFLKKIKKSNLASTNFWNFK